MVFSSAGDMVFQSNAPLCAAYTLIKGLYWEASVRRLYYLAEDLRTTQQISDELHDAGISNWNFHVVAKDADGLYRHHIHSATPIHELDIVHTGERWALVSALICLLVGLTVHYGQLLPWQTSLTGVVVFTLVGGLFGAWEGGMIGMTRENYKLAPFHDEIEAGRFLVMVDVDAGNKARVREIMNMQFPQAKFCGRDSVFINPFKRPTQIYHQTTH